MRGLGSNAGGTFTPMIVRDGSIHRATVPEVRTCDSRRLDSSQWTRRWTSQWTSQWRWVDTDPRPDRGDPLELVRARWPDPGALFQAMVENSAHLWCVVDRDGTTLYANRASIGLLGLTPDELVG